MTHVSQQLRMPEGGPNRLPPGPGRGRRLPDLIHNQNTGTVEPIPAPSGGGGGSGGNTGTVA